MGLEQHEGEEIMMRDLTSGCKPFKVGTKMMLTFKITWLILRQHCMYT